MSFEEGAKAIERAKQEVGTETRYWLTTPADNFPWGPYSWFAGRLVDNLQVWWAVIGRNGELPANGLAPSLNFELMTADEALEFASYLDGKHGAPVWVSKHLLTPDDHDDLDYALTWVPTGGGRAQYPLYQEPGYPFEFKVVGCYHAFDDTKISDGTTGGQRWWSKGA